MPSVPDKILIIIIIVIITIIIVKIAAWEIYSAVIFHKWKCRVLSIKSSNMQTQSHAKKIDKQTDAHIHTNT